MPFLIFDNYLGIFPFARLAEAGDTISKISTKCGRWQFAVSHISQSYVSLMHMAARNNAATKYLAIEENFLLAAIHVAAMKNIPFAEGTLPDLPADMPSVPPGYVLFLLP